MSIRIGNRQITGGTDVTSEAVIQALGYTPYSNANPAGYTSNTGTVTSVNNIEPVSGNVTLTIPVQASDINALPDTTKYAYSFDMNLDSNTYILTITLKDQDGTTLTSKNVDFPIESVVVNGLYNSTNKKIVLTLTSGSTIDVPVGDLVSGLQSEITSTNKLDADLIDDSTASNKFVTSSEKTTWNNKQDTITDINTIRTNATSGANAATTISSYGDIVTHNANEFLTQHQDISGKANTADLATVATSGSYNDLINKPTIPTTTTSVTQNSVAALTSGGAYTALLDKQDINQLINVLATSGTITLTDNSINSITPSGTVTFTLPTISDNTTYHEILVQVKMSTVVSINVGTTYYFNKTAPDLSEAGVYNIIYSYDKANEYWVCGALNIGTAS